MKVLFLTLLLGLVCSAQEEEAEQGVSELSGIWIPVFTATRNLEKPDEKVSPGVYLCHLVFDEKQGTIDFDIYVEVDGEWKIIHVTGKMQDEWTYIADSEWIKEIIVTDVSDTVRIVCIVYVDKEGRAIRFTVILGHGYKESPLNISSLYQFHNILLSTVMDGAPDSWSSLNIDEKALEILKELKKVDENCIAKLLGIGVCPPCGFTLQQLL